MTDTTAAKLGSCTDAELKRIMSMLAGCVDECMAKLDDEKRSQSAAHQQAGSV